MTNTVIFVVSGKLMRSQETNSILYVGSSYEEVSRYFCYADNSDMIVELWENGTCLRRIENGDDFFGNF